MYIQHYYTTRRDATNRSAIGALVLAPILFHCLTPRSRSFSRIVQHTTEIAKSTMFSNPSFASGSSSNIGQEPRPNFPHAHSHSQHGSMPFNVAGMSGPTAQSPSLRSSTLGSGPLSMSMGPSLGMSESRSHYQPGYLMVCVYPALFFVHLLKLHVHVVVRLPK